MSKLHFELYAYGDPYLRVDLNENESYCIEQADKFEAAYYEKGLSERALLGRFDTIYGALDAANAHAAQKLAEEDKGAPKVDEFIMPERADLEVFEDNQPSDRPTCKLWGYRFDGELHPAQIKAILDGRMGPLGESDINPSSTIDKSYQKEFIGNEA